MKFLHLACLNNDPETQPILGPKCAPVGGEPLTCIHKYTGATNMMVSKLKCETSLIL